MEEQQQNPRDDGSLLEMVVRFDVADIMRSVEIAQRKTERSLRIATGTVVEILTEELLNEGFEFSILDNTLSARSPGSYALVEEVLAGDYSSILGLLATKMETVLQDALDEPIVGCGDIRVAKCDSLSFALYFWNT